MPYTAAEKILARAGSAPNAKAGDIVMAKPDRMMSHDNAALVIQKFREMGGDRVLEPDKLVIPIDHRVPANTEKAAAAQKEIRQFAREKGLGNYLDVNAGICHQAMMELGYVLPGQLIVGSDSHSTTYGALNAAGTGIGATEMAGIWLTGELWMKVPKTIGVNVEGKLRPGVYGKDLTLALLSKLGPSGADYRSLEFYGDGIRFLSMSSRMTLANMSVEAGAKFGIVIMDESTLMYLNRVTKERYQPVFSDEGADFEKDLDLRAEFIEPMVAAPHSPCNGKPVGDVEGVEVQQCVIGSCTNGRLEDLEIAAKILEGKKVHPGTRLIVVPASPKIYDEAIQYGAMETLLRAGATVCNPGCGPCMGAHQGILAPGETAISTTNRNFKGRMGSTEASIYLASPATVAASAIEGKIADPRRYLDD